MTQTRKSRSFKDTDKQAYVWEGVPRALIAAAIAKCKAQDPPVSLKWQLERLLRAWVEEGN